MSTNRAPIAITGFGWEIPTFGVQPSLTEALQHAQVDNPVFSPELTLGKKGLRYKERSTLMAMCAAKLALQHAGLVDDASRKLDDPGFGVAVASNTGNLDTVCRAAETIRREHVNATSSMDLPNASSNIVASTIAIRFGLKALNLMICSGASASLDALIVAANAIRNGRAQRMLVATVESGGSALCSLLAGGRQELDEAEAPLLEGAGAVVLEARDYALDRGAIIHGYLSDHMYAHADAHDAQPARDWFARQQSKSIYLPGGSFLSRMASGHDQVIDLGGPITRSYGSAALLQLIHACEQLRGTAPVRGFDPAGDGVVIVGGGNWMDRRGGAVAVDAPGRADGTAR